MTRAEATALKAYVETLEARLGLERSIRLGTDVMDAPFRAQVVTDALEALEAEASG